VYSHIIPAFICLLGGFIIFGVTLSLSLRIFKIHGIRFYLGVAVGIISFVLTITGWILCRAAIFAWAYYQGISSSTISFLLSGYPAFVILICLAIAFHAFMNWLLAIYFLKVRWQSALAASLLTEIFNAILIFLMIFLFLFMWFGGYPFTDHQVYL
jgi:hypothetical protein